MIIPPPLLLPPIWRKDPASTPRKGTWPIKRPCVVDSDTCWSALSSAPEEVIPLLHMLIITTILSLQRIPSLPVLGQVIAHARRVIFIQMPLRRRTQSRASRSSTSFARLRCQFARIVVMRSCLTSHDQKDHLRVVRQDKPGFSRECFKLLATMNFRRQHEVEVCVVSPEVPLCFLSCPGSYHPCLSSMCIGCYKEMFKPNSQVSHSM